MEKFLSLCKRLRTRYDNWQAWTAKSRRHEFEYWFRDQCKRVRKYRADNKVGYLVRLKHNGAKLAWFYQKSEALSYIDSVRDLYSPGVMFELSELIQVNGQCMTDQVTRNSRMTMEQWSEFLGL